MGEARNAGIVRERKKARKEGKDILQELRVAQHVIKVVGSAGK